MKKFRVKINIIEINPFVYIPEIVLKEIFIKAGKEKSPIPVRGTIEGNKFIQTLVKFIGEWRLYINRPMMKSSAKKIGDLANFEIEFDPVERLIPVHPKLEEALKSNRAAKKVFCKLNPSRQKEIIRYISFLKTASAIDKNITKLIQFLSGESRYIGRDKP